MCFSSSTNQSPISPPVPLMSCHISLVPLAAPSAMVFNPRTGSTRNFGWSAIAPPSVPKMYLNISGVWARPSPMRRSQGVSFLRTQSRSNSERVMAACGSSCRRWSSIMLSREASLRPCDSSSPISSAICSSSCSSVKLSIAGIP